MKRAVLQALSSLRGAPADVIAPSRADVPYRANDRRGIAPLADLYLPSTTTGASVVLVHGGGFLIGSRRMKPMRLLASRLCAAGIAVCVIDYRLIFRGGRLDEALDDVCDAFAFWLDLAPTLGLDPHALSLVGLSAGATLAMLAASRLGNVARLACCFGLYDADHFRGPLVTLWPRLLFRTANRAQWNERSPRGAVQPTTPTLLLHGAADGLVHVDQASRLAAHRESLGLPTRLVIYPEAPHGFFNLPCAASDAGIREIIEHVSPTSSSGS
ncbi:MAG TPA: alpha/beta hydrolase [Kofleriaceae bacterium]|jgi:acetyl esterase/lipase